MFKTIEKSGTALVIEKKSKFIANCFYIESVEEAEKTIDRIKKEYHDARHNCYAYRVMTENRVVERQSDDGEPSGTAGAPMLNILEKRNLTNVLIVVTRYFGGILLGTGGLVKAYSEATVKAVENSKEVEKQSGYIAEITVGYDMQSELEYICEKNKINIISKDYKEKIKNIVEISEEKYVEIFQKSDQIILKKIPITIKEKKYINKM